MTISTMHSWFNLLIDKFNSPYFQASEIDLLLNRAQSNYVNKMVYDRSDTQEGVVVTSKSEYSSNWHYLLYPLVKTVTLPTSATNSIEINDVKTDASPREFAFILSILDEKSEDIMFVRHNDRGRFERNSFKRPSINKKRYEISDNLLKFLPSSIPIGTNFVIKYLVKPLDMSLTAARSCELPESTHDKIVAAAAELAGITTTDEGLQIINSITE